MFDFAGPYTVNTNDFAFGRVLKYAPIQVDEQKMKVAVYQANIAFERRPHNLIFNNCHSHVAMALSLAGANGRSKWGGWGVFWHLLTKGRYVDWWAVVRTYMATVLLYGVILALVLL